MLVIITNPLRVCTRIHGNLLDYQLYQLYCANQEGLKGYLVVKNGIQSTSCIFLDMLVSAYCTVSCSCHCGNMLLHRARLCPLDDGLIILGTSDSFEWLPDTDRGRHGCATCVVVVDSLWLGGVSLFSLVPATCCFACQEVVVTFLVQRLSTCN